MAIASPPSLANTNPRVAFLLTLAWILISYSGCCLHYIARFATWQVKNLRGIYGFLLIRVLVHAPIRFISSQIQELATRKRRSTWYWIKMLCKHIVFLRWRDYVMDSTAQCRISDAASMVKLETYLTRGSLYINIIVYGGLPQSC